MSDQPKPLTTAERLATAEGQLRRIRRAWTVPGRVPGYHEAWKQRLRKEWPLLAAALDELD